MKLKFFFLVLVLLIESIYAQNFTEYFTGNSTDVSTNHSSGVCVMGGASENDNAMIWFLQQANGGDVVVLRASGSDGYNNYMYSQLGVSINSVTTFVIANEVGATDPHVLQRVANAEAIWFAGGDQFDYVSFFKDNEMENTLNDFINTKRGVIGGTSAGMAILGSGYFSAENGTVTNAQALSNPYNSRMTLGYNDFLEIPYLENVITDTHYDDPDRRARHTTFLARYATDNNTSAFGIACNEYTAVCIDESGIAHVFGEYPTYPEFAYFLQVNCTTNNSPETCEAGEPLTWNRGGEALKVAKIAGLENGSNFIDLMDWSNEQGAEWENWYVDDGTFFNTSTVNPQCDALTIDEQLELDITVSPNPFQDQIRILSNKENLQVLLYDASGKHYVVSIEGDLISTEELSSGIYFLSLTDGVRTQIFKLIKR